MQDPYHFEVRFEPDTEPPLAAAMLKVLTEYLAVIQPEDLCYNQIRLWPASERKLWLGRPLDYEDMPDQGYLIVGYWNLTTPTSGYGEYLMLGADDWLLYSSDSPFEEDFLPLNPPTTNPEETR